MLDSNAWHDEFGGEEEGPVLVRRKSVADTELDMTPMIDCVFQLLIFFLVASVPDSQTAVQLPPARHGAAVDPQKAIIITLADPGGKGPAEVYLADGKLGRPLPSDPAAQEEAVARAVEAAHRDGKAVVMIKAERSVRQRDVGRVASAAATVEGMRLHLAVFEIK